MRSTRLAVPVVVLLALVATLAPPAYADRSGPPTERAPHRAASVPVDVGTYNIRAKVKLKAFKRAVRAFRQHVDVAGLQEIGSNKRRKFLERQDGWGYFRPKRIQQNPVIWRTEVFELERGRGPKIAESRSLGGEHPDDAPKKDSTATVVRLRHRASGERVSVVNVHLMHGAVKAGRPWPGRPKTFDLYADQVRGLLRVVRAEREWVRQEGGRVLATGDFNAGWVADERWRHKRLPFRQFKRIGFRSMWQGSPAVDKPYGTRNDALIDQVWSGDKPSRTRILRAIKASDHRPAVATYRLPG